MSRRPTLSSALNWVLSLLVLRGFGWAVHHYWGWQRLFTPWASVPVVLVALVVVAQFASYSVRGYRVYYAVPEIPRGRWHDCLKLILLNNVINLMLPARTGEASFPVLLRRWFGVTLGRGAGTLLWLRLVDLTVLIVLALAVLGRVAFPGDAGRSCRGVVCCRLGRAAGCASGAGSRRPAADGSFGKDRWPASQSLGRDSGTEEPRLG